MHELTLAESVLNIVETAARRAGGQRVTRIKLALGLLAHVEEDTLIYCCQLVARNSLAADARFEVVRLPGEAWCADCHGTVTLASLQDACPACGSHALEPRGSDEMRVVDIGIS